ncbi:MAG: putative lipid II flippase FtsW [Firmicutes bacterium]|nr:putative lipid II flippase FtsW [Bacillota bacterium]
MRRISAEQEQRKLPDFTIFFTVLILTAIGLVMVFSASYITALESRGDAFYFLRRQAFWACLGLIGMVFTANFNYKKWHRMAPVLLFLNFIFLLLVFIPGLGEEYGGARRWISMGGLFTIQPAEFTKLVLVIFTASFLSKKNIDMDDFWRSSFVPLLMMAISFLLIIKQPDLGTAVTLALAVGVIVFAAGMPFKQLFCLASFSLPAMLYFSMSEEYRMERIFSFLDPWADPLDTGYHIIQSLYALGPGGLFGVGLGRSRQKLYYLPEPQNDFIFSIIGEELGFLGAVTIMLLFFVLIWRGFKTSLMAPDTFSSLLAMGITVMVAVQTLLNIGVVTGSIPVTGITLPLISAGGSSLFFTMCGLGIIMNISRYNR